MPLISYFNVRGTYTGEDVQKLTTYYADLARGAKGDIECPRSNEGDIEMPSIQLVSFNAENLLQYSSAASPII